MIINLTYASRCARCKRPEKGQLRAAMIITPIRWWLWSLGVKFRICPACADEMVQRADANPKLTCVEKRYG